MGKGAQLRTTISPDVMRGLSAEADRLGVPLRDVVEARLRQSFDAPDGNERLLLHVDDGLMAWLKAVDRSKFFGITFNDCVCYLLRSAVIDITDKDFWFPRVVDQLDEPWRSRLQGTAKYERLKTE